MLTYVQPSIYLSYQCFLTYYIKIVGIASHFTKFYKSFMHPSIGQHTCMDLFKTLRFACCTEVLMNMQGVVYNHVIREEPRIIFFFFCLSVFCSTVSLISLQNHYTVNMSVIKITTLEKLIACQSYYVDTTSDLTTCSINWVLYIIHWSKVDTSYW